MFGIYQCVYTGSEDDSSCSQSLSFPDALSVKKKTVPLHRRVRHLDNTSRVMPPLNIFNMSPVSAKEDNWINSLQETEEKFVGNSLENIEEAAENEHTFPASCVDPLEDLFPSQIVHQSELSDSVSEFSIVGRNNTSLEDKTEMHEQPRSLDLEKATPIINKTTGCVLDDISNKKNVLHSKIQSDIKETPRHQNWNQGIINTIQKDDDKENINYSRYHSKVTPRPYNFLTPSTTKQYVTSCSSKSNRMENKNIVTTDVRHEKCPSIRKKLELQTQETPGYTRSMSVKIPQPFGPQLKITPEEKSQHFFVINGKRYSVQSLLGRGGSSKVYEVLDPGTLHHLAVKEVDLSMGEPSIIQGYLQEIDVLRKLQDSESIIKMIDCEYIEEEQKLYVVMEKGDTDLSKLIKEITKNKPMPVSMIVHYWTEMLRAVKDIHTKKVIHSDLKPANFLLVCGRLKLIDFGIASSVQNDMTSVYKDVQTGTYNYISPEALQITYNNEKDGVIKISYKSDIWSLGCILYNLLFGKTPFQHIVPTFAKLTAITNKNHHIEYPSARSDCLPVLLHAVKCCLTHDPKKRPTAAELLELPYFNTNPVIP